MEQVTSFINITVVSNDPVVAYIPDDISLLSNSSVLDLSPISTGGLVTQWSITPELSAGLYFNTQLDNLVELQQKWLAAHNTQSQQAMMMEQCL